MSGWIGVDLDGTIAHYEGWNGGKIGRPIPLMSGNPEGHPRNPKPKQPTLLEAAEAFMSTSTKKTKDYEKLKAAIERERQTRRDQAAHKPPSPASHVRNAPPMARVPVRYSGAAPRALYWKRHGAVQPCGVASVGRMDGAANGICLRGRKERHNRGESEMTVLEAFKLAYGPLPSEDVTGCYIGYSYDYEGASLCPTIICDGHLRYSVFHGGGEWDTYGDEEFGPNVINHPAEGFRDFFGDKYDAVLDQMSTVEMGNTSGERKEVEG